MWVFVIRSPLATDEEVQSILRNIRKYANYRLLLMGDFNYREINWEDSYSDAEGKEFMNTVNDCFLTQHVIKPTRGKNILDLVLTSEPGMVEEITVECPVVDSDHNVLLRKFNSFTYIENKERKYYGYKNAK